MDWKHGYFASGGYTFGYYPETMPSRLRWAALVQGHASPARGFRYLDAGCGQGFNLLLAAAAHPDSEFVGVDFLPEHIAHARALAEACGLTNVRFVEGDFVELAEDSSSLGEFDYAVCHGISIWIGADVRQSLFQVISRVLKPGGLFYNSYNTFPGWLGSVPFQHLVLLEQKSKSGEQALFAARDSLKALAECAPPMFKSLPALESRMKALEEQDPAYLVQEYNHDVWQPVFVSRMVEELQGVKLNYLGTATLPEAYDKLMPRPLLELLNRQSDPVVREQLRDYATNQSFRRDLYVKGKRQPWPGDMAVLLGSFLMTVNTLQPRPEGEEPYVIRCGTGETKGDRKFYDAIMDRVAKEPAGTSVSELLALRRDPAEKGEVLQAVSMLMYGGWLLPVLPDGEKSRSAGGAVNRHLASAVCKGAPYRYVSMPLVGCALPMRDTEWMIMDCEFRGVPRKNWLAEVNAALKRLNRGLLREGQPVEDAAVRDEILNQGIEDFVNNRLPLLERAGGT